MTSHTLGAVDTPRVQAGPSPQHLLATVLGEYLDSSDARLPAAALVAVLAEFGISPGSTRAALARLVRRGLVASQGSGRSTTYHVRPDVIVHHHAVMHAFLAFGAQPRQWDGHWVVVSYSLPESGQPQRHAVRKALGARGFARLYDSVWISPAPDAVAVRESLRGLLTDVPGARWSVMRARFEDDPAGQGPANAYDLAGLAAAYRTFVADHAALRADVRARRVRPAQALVARATLMDAWRTFADTDPDLPAELLPASWPRPQARETFLEVHTALGPLAQERLIELMAPSWPDAASWVTHFVAADDPLAAPRGGRH
ncbi:PaaX family transcriptional regulator [Cellulomonas xiejunii]|uniref:PaaX family transcriptional regulator n=1 Tax=Cellulomonas xiejunii TaxID=2968083 RepID=A0ABY5KMD5_9CELL|nr:PaaX family transcriptional regulator C-terminal domain-containing protein [Cellulomonas xiejunii]MCC2319886.1 PaaX family transcriptional regulator [Cellulomonas xiejunii]UUI70210.1 PaaX family transcriptional regulator [Cellulomonas xiejunii]